MKTEMLLATDSEQPAFSQSGCLAEKASELATMIQIGKSLLSSVNQTRKPLIAKNDMFSKIRQVYTLNIDCDTSCSDASAPSSSTRTF